MSRLAATFAGLRKAAKPGLVTYITAGDPTLPRTRDVLRALDRAGADVMEVGVPFSDPLADGPVIQRATERALASHTTLSGVLDLIGDVRGDIRAPVVIFSYANPILRLGAERFADRARDAGVDGVLVLDLPIEEADDFRNMLGKRGIDTILLLSPTTTDDRLRKGGSPRQRVSVCDFAAGCDRRSRSTCRRRPRDGRTNPACQLVASGARVWNFQA
jgi:tryptophan synthase alpha chain